MNCANHSQNPAAAYCRTCGKPLCTACTRQVMGVIYCENCLAERVAGTAPPQAPYQRVDQGARITPSPSTGPNPGLAGILGAIPFGVGAIYCGQYTKGLIHLAVFVSLVVALSSNLPDYWYPILGIGMAFFVVYQIIDSVHTARAIQSGRPAPDPFGLTTMFSSGEQIEFSKNVPTGAIVLIGLGVLFLLHNLVSLRVGVLLPLVLIGLGVWLLVGRLSVRRVHGIYRGWGLMWPAILITLGVQFLLDNLGVISFGRTLPVLMIVIGVILAVQRSSAGGYTESPPPASTAINPPDAHESEIPPSSTEVKNG